MAEDARIPIRRKSVGDKLRDTADVQSFPALMKDYVQPALIVNPEDFQVEITVGSVTLTDGTDTALVNADGSLFAGYLTTATASRGSNGTTVIGTVPANKVWDVYFATAMHTAAAAAYGNINLNGVSVCNYLVTATPIVGASGAFQPALPVRLTAGQTADLVVFGWASGSIVGTIAYIERDA